MYGRALNAMMEDSAFKIQHSRFNYRHCTALEKKKIKNKQDLDITKIKLDKKNYAISKHDLQVKDSHTENTENYAVTTTNKSWCKTTRSQWLIGISYTHSAALQPQLYPSSWAFFYGTVSLLTTCRSDISLGREVNPVEIHVRMLAQYRGENNLSEKFMNGQNWFKAGRASKTMIMDVPMQRSQWCDNAPAAT